MENIEKKTAPQIDAINSIDVPNECVENVVAEMDAMRKAYIARSICAANRKKKTIKKRRTAEKNAKKMRKAQRKRRK